MSAYLKGLCHPDDAPEGIQPSEINYLVSLIDKQLKVHCSEDRMKAISRNSISELKYKYKKLKEDQKYLVGKYDKIKSRLMDNNRLLDKIRANSLRSHGSRSASKHREMEYLSIRKFGRFLTYLKKTIESLTLLDEGAYERDLKMIQLTLESQFHPAGNILCSVEANRGTKKTIQLFKENTLPKLDLRYLEFDDSQLP